ncbi:MAG: DNA topoisomerase, partial [bacterium]
MARKRSETEQAAPKKKTAAKKPATKTRAVAAKKVGRTEHTADEPVAKGGRGRDLVIVESPKKAKSINKFLGSGVIVKASMGHVRDLPKRKLGVDVKHGFEPTYEIMPGKADTIAELRKDAARAQTVYMATDPDREGEAIAWHLQAALDLPDERVKRVMFYEITERAVKEAFNKATSIDIDKVNAQQARRFLDRFVGYELSPLLWKKVTRNLSAGRVQSVAVRLIAEREKEINAFVTEEYWRITATLATSSEIAKNVARELAKQKAKLAPEENEEDPDAEQPVETVAKYELPDEAFQAELTDWNGAKAEIGIHMVPGHDHTRTHFAIIVNNML